MNKPLSGSLECWLIMSWGIVLNISHKNFQISSRSNFQRYIMDQDKKEHKLKRRLSEFIRCVLYIAVVIFLMSCIAILFLEQQQMKQRLTAIDDKVTTFERALQYNNERDKRLEAKGFLDREKRAVALSLESLEKRLKVLEFRWDFFNLQGLRDSEGFSKTRSVGQCDKQVFLY